MERDQTAADGIGSTFFSDLLRAMKKDKSLAYAFCPFVSCQFLTSVID